MDYFRKYLGGQQGEAGPTGAETVERLCERVQSSTLLEDRRDAVRALKSLSKVQKFRLEVGTQGMEVLINVLNMDRADSEITGYALETLYNVMSNEICEDDDELPLELPSDLGNQFSEMFVKAPDNVSLLLSLLEEYDSHVRCPTVRLLTVLLGNRGKELQEAILVAPMGVSKLMDLIMDSRDFIRNDGLLLLIQLTKGNANIQKIVAFESAFERLLDIVQEEGNSDGSIVVEDCLLLMLNLLKNNSSNQNYFKEGSYIQRLPPYFELAEEEEDSEQAGWSAQKVTNIHLMLQLVRTLVSPSSPALQITACQRVMNHCGLLQQLCTILMASGVPADVLTETINTVSEVIRGNTDNQEYFASVMAPSNPPRPAIVVLLMSMVNEKQPFVLRCAVLYCFQSFLYKNELGQSQIVQTLLPSTADANTISAGQLLCGGLFSADSMSTWFAATALLHSIVDNSNQKEQLLRVQLATSLGNPPVSLLQQCSNILAQGGKLQTRVGLLMLMCHWVAHCPIAVTHFLHNPSNVPFLISQVSASEGDEQEMLVQGLCAFMLGLCVQFNNDSVDNYQRQQLRQVIEKRIGLERFSDKLTQVTKHESYSRAAKQPQMNYREPADVLFDYEFTKLFRGLETEVIKSVSPVQENTVQSKAMLDQHESIVKQYKELIREQDTQLNAVKAELIELQSQHSEAESRLKDMVDQVQQLKDQNALLKASRGSSVSLGENSIDAAKLQKDLETKSKDLQERDELVERLKNDLSLAEAKVLSSSSSGEDVIVNDSAMLQVSVNRLTEQLSDLEKKLEAKEAELREWHRKVEQRDEEVRLYKSKYEETSKQMTVLSEKLSSNSTDDNTHTVLLTERNAMSAKISEQESRIQCLEMDNSGLQQTQDNMQAENSSLKEQMQRLESEKIAAEEARASAEEEAKGQEDLLVLLTDQDNKLRNYRHLLRKHGEPVTDDDEDDDDDDELELSD